MLKRTDKKKHKTKIDRHRDGNKKFVKVEIIKAGDPLDQILPRRRANVLISKGLELLGSAHLVAAAIGASFSLIGNSFIEEFLDDVIDEFSSEADGEGKPVNPEVWLQYLYLPFVVFFLSINLVPSKFSFTRDVNARLVIFSIAFLLGLMSFSMEFGVFPVCVQIGEGDNTKFSLFASDPCKDKEGFKEFKASRVGSHVTLGLVLSSVLFYLPSVMAGRFNMNFKRLLPVLIVCPVGLIFHVIMCEHSSLDFGFNTLWGFYMLFVPALIIFALQKIIVGRNVEVKHVRESEVVPVAAVCYASVVDSLVSQFVVQMFDVRYLLDSTAGGK